MYTRDDTLVTSRFQNSEKVRNILFSMVLEDTKSTSVAVMECDIPDTDKQITLHV